jgi:hypothetical protein
MNLIQQLAWRTSPGTLGEHASSMQSIHALLGYFLRDRSSPTPFPGRDALAHAETFDWGIAPPLEKVIGSEQELDLLLSLPEIYRQSISVVEPWPDVGVNLQGEAVRASKNVAYILQQVADADTILYPIWRSGVPNAERLANILSAGLATVFEGGNPSVYDRTSFNGVDTRVDEMLELVDHLLLRRSAGSASTVFVCLGHQMAAASQIRLLQRAVREVLSLDALSLDDQGHALAALKKVCADIQAVGESLRIIKNETVIAIGWNHPHFAVSANEDFEIGTRRLLPYQRAQDCEHIPGELIDTHALIADELEGVIDTMLSMERELSIEMFHGDEVNEEAALFANWAFKRLHDAIVPIRYEIAVSPLSWMLQMPYAVEILSQTQVNENTMTEVGTTCIYYKDWETHNIRRSFSCQFHPELMADIRDIGKRAGPRYAELKDNDGARLLIRLLYHGMQE